MTVCGISWCIALTNEQFCPLHKHHKDWRPEQNKRWREAIVAKWPTTPWDDGYV